MLKAKDEQKNALIVKQNHQIVDHKMKRGKYQLHVLVESTSSLYGNNQQDALQVIIKLQAFGKTQHSTIKSDIGYQQTFWGEDFFFKTQFDDPTIAAGQKLTIGVYDRKKKIYDSQIGKSQFSISSIYAESNHTILHRWMALSNTDLDITQVVGYIKISVSVIQQNDKAIELEPQKASSQQKGQKQINVHIPQSIQRKLYELIVQIFQGQNILAANKKICDPYIGVQFGHLFEKTSPFPKQKNPRFLEKIYLPISYPALNQKIALRINDFSYFQKIQVLGSYYINIKQLINLYNNRQSLQHTDKKQQNSQKNFKNDQNRNSKSKIKKQKAINKLLSFTEKQWINFYGPSNEASNSDFKNIYQFFPQKAPYYVGSLLVCLSIRQKDLPQRKVIKIKQPPTQNSIKQIFQIKASIYGAINLYKKSKTFKIQISMGQFKRETKDQKTINGFCSWNVEQIFNVQFYQNQLLPDIFVYLIDQNDKVMCFNRYFPKFTQQDLQKQNEIKIINNEWILMKPDKSNYQIQDQDGGYLYLSLSISKNKRKSENITRKLSNILPKVQQEKNNGRLIIDLICADNILPLDIQGTSDTFFQFLYMKKSVYSTTKKQSLCPIFCERLIIQCDVQNQAQKLFPLIIKTYDQDKFTKQLLGTTFINLKQGINQNYLKFNLTDKPQPKWFQIKHNNLTVGRVLASFRIINKPITQIPKTINLPCQKYSLTFLILGLRGLKINSLIFSKKNPYLVFDLDSFNAFQNQLIPNSLKNGNKDNNDQNKNVTKNIVTTAQQMQQVLNLNMLQKKIIFLPQDPNYWPCLSVKIYNRVIAEIHQPLIGYLSIDLKKSYQQTQKNKQKYTKQNLIISNKSLSTNQFEQNPRLKNIHTNLLYKLRNAIIMSLNYQWVTMSQKIKLNNKKDLKNYDPNLVVVFPFYNPINQGKSYRELYKEKINSKQINGSYMKIGVDNNQARAKKSLLQRQKHYRFTTDLTLQDFQQKRTGSNFGFFEEYFIKTGRKFASNTLKDQILKKITQQNRIIGKYKGNTFIQKFSESYDKKISDQQRNTLKSYLKVQKFHLFLYIIQAYDLPSKDLMSQSDPYLVVKIGNQVFDFQKQYIQDTNNPQFNKKIHKEVKLPQDSVILIQLWDYDPYVSNDFIGFTFVDLQNRVFHQKKNLTFNNPIETHQLMAKQSSFPQGSIRFWLDLVPSDKLSLYRQFQIGNKDESQFQVRIIVWNCSQIPENDVEGMSDLFVTCSFNNETQTTDTHIRASQGRGTFNWRCVYPVKLPSNNPSVTLKVFDKDLLKSNDYIASQTFDITDLLEEAFETQEAQKFYAGQQDLTKDQPDVKSSFIIKDDKKFYDVFEIDLIARPKKDQNNKQKKAQKIGKVQLSIEILPKALAKRKQVGKGRSAPNQYPYLAEPKDRFQWSWNPFTLASRLCGKSFRYKICLFICCFVFFFIIIAFGYTFGGSLIANLVTN